MILTRVRLALRPALRHHRDCSHRRAGVAEVDEAPRRFFFGPFDPGVGGVGCVNPSVMLLARISWMSPLGRSRRSAARSQPWLTLRTGVGAAGRAG
jgi:hypothetical protein